MGYREMIQKAVGKEHYALEIGPSYNPILPKAQGYKTTVFDHLSREGLLEKYRQHAIDASRIEEVDVIGTALSEITGKFYSIVASHIIEHTPDLISFIRDCSRLMHDWSVLFLIVPDKRHVFDAIRPLTSTGNVIDALLSGRKRHIGSIFDTKSFAVSRNGKNLWGPSEEAPFTSIHNFTEAKKLLNAAMGTDSYVDAHAWCFTPASFRLIMFDLAGLGLIDLVEHEFHIGGTSEFYVAMRKGRIDDSSASKTRAELATAAWKEQVGFFVRVKDRQLNVRE